MTKHIYVPVNRKKIKMFVGIYSVLGLNGKPNISIFTHTKSPQELNETMPKWAVMQKNVGQEDLHWIESNNAAGDSTQKLSAHSSLTRGVVLFKEASGLP